MSPKEFKNYADNLKRTALGVKFARTLFTNPESLSPKTIANVLTSLGLEIPESVVMTAEVAQVILAGQAVADGLSAGKSLSELNSATNMTASGVRTLTSIASSKEWIDSDSASVIQIGTSVAMLVASAGTDVSSWVSLALSLNATMATKQGLADYRAAINAQELMRARITPQQTILAETFKDFQEKNISIYGVIAKMAVESPDLWPQVITPDSPITKIFPDLMMLPTVGTSVTGHGTAEIRGDWPWPAKGSYVIARWEGDKTIGFTTLGTSFNKETSAQYFFELLLRPWISVYSVANSEIVDRGNMSMQSIAALSYMVNHEGEISDTSDYVGMLIGSCLTPYDFNDNILDSVAVDFVKDSYKGQETNFHESGVSYGLSQSNISFNKFQRDLEIMRKKLETVKDSEDISELAQYPYIYKKLQRYMDFQKTSFERDPTLGGKLNQKFSQNSVRAWRKLKNYIAVLQMIDTFRTDSYLSTTSFAQKLLPFMPSVDAFSDKVEQINYLSTMRGVNRVSLTNISSFLGVPVEKLVKITDSTYKGAAKFTIK